MLKFQYNKTTIQDLKRQLSIRQKALPILQNKETALRQEVVDRKKELETIKLEKLRILNMVSEQEGLWKEMPRILIIENKEIISEKVIGVKVPTLQNIQFKVADFSWWHYPGWLPTGIELLKKAILLDIRGDLLTQQIQILDQARKKTTQKVNLYEKVQIPEMENAILKIKRFLEDKENIAKSAQKIMKKLKSERREVST